MARSPLPPRHNPLKKRDRTGFISLFRSSCNRWNLRLLCAAAYLKLPLRGSNITKVDLIQLSIQFELYYHRNERYKSREEGDDGIDCSRS